jgi:hypothetical protein
VWRGGQVVTSVRFLRESSPLLTPCPLLGERPESFYGQIFRVSILCRALLERRGNIAVGLFERGFLLDNLTFS